MTRRTRQLYLSGIAAFTAFMAVLFFAMPGPPGRQSNPPRDLKGMANWLNRHPADWQTAGTVSDRALDSSLPGRVALWRTSYELTERLNPLRLNAPAAFVRGGLFHWYELDRDARQQVLEAAEPLMRDPKLFASLHAPLYDLTRDFGYLRRNATVSNTSLHRLSSLAATNGLFDEYRSLRQAQRVEREKAFQRGRNAEHPAELMELLPDHLDAQDQSLVSGILEEIDRKPFDAQRMSRRAEDITLFAMRHHLQPLSALAPLVEARGALSDPTRARLALALGNPGQASKVELTAANTRSAEWVPYHLERAILEARNGDSRIADAYLMRTTALGVDDRVLFSAEQVATILGDSATASRYHKELLAAAQRPRLWSETCSANELCVRAVSRQYVPDPNGSIRVTMSVVQSDQVPPYVELFIDDALVAEGPIGDATVFEASVKPGLHRLEVRLVNPRTRNQIQRRVRLS